MKIGFISSYFYERERMNYGAYPYIYNIIDRISKAEDSFVIASGFPKRPANEIIEGIKVFRTPSIPYDFFGLHFISLGIVSLRKVLKEQPDILNSQDVDAAFLFKELNILNKKIPKVLSLKALRRGWFARTPNSKMRFYDRIISAWQLFCIKNADEIIVPSNYFKGEVIEFCNLEQERIHVIPNGIDTELFKPLEKNIEEPTLFFAGGESVRKGSDIVIDSFIQLKNEFEKLKLIIIGTSNLKRFQDRLKENNVQIGSDILCFQRIPYSQMPYYINQADIVLHPSYHETFGGIIAEAMACEKPVVTTNTTAMPEIVGDTNALIEPNNSQELTSITRELLLDERKRRICGKKGRKRILKYFTLERAKNDYLALFNSLK